jgi:Putative zinc-finger
MTCPSTVTLGAYLLGALDPQERYEFETHLGGCETCRTELVRLAPLPGMLNQISLDDFADGLPPTTLEETAPVPGLPLPNDLPPGLMTLSQTLSQSLSQSLGPAGHEVPSPRGGMPGYDAPPPSPTVVDTSDTPDTPPRTKVVARRRRNYVRVAVAAAIVLVVAVGGVVGWGALEESPPPEPPGITWSATAADRDASADARLVDHEWGTEVQLKIHGMPPGRTCYLIVYDHEGNREITGWWGTDHDPDTEIPASTSFARSKIDKLELRLDDRSLALTISSPTR